VGDGFDSGFHPSTERFSDQELAVEYLESDRDGGFVAAAADGVTAGSGDRVKVLTQPVVDPRETVRAFGAFPGAEQITQQAVAAVAEKAVIGGGRLTAGAVLMPGLATPPTAPHVTVVALAVAVGAPGKVLPGERTPADASHHDCHDARS
jgi:hypothetical protein